MTQPQPVQSPKEPPSRVLVAGVRRFLIWLAAADPLLLRRCPSERLRFEVMGAAVFTTAGLGAVSCVFAMVMAVRLPLAAAVVVGIGWGVAILNIDRLLIGGIHRRPTFWGNIGSALPRMGLALLIGAVVSTPLVLRIFESEINAQLDINRRTAQEKFRTDLDRDPRFTPIPALTRRAAELERIVTDGPADTTDDDPKVKRLQAEFDRAEEAYQQAEKDVICENEGKCGSNRVGRGPAYQEKLERRNRLKAERDAKRAELDRARAEVGQRQAAGRDTTMNGAGAELNSTRAELARLVNLKRAAEDGFAASSANDRGLLARIGALDDLRERDGTLGTAYLFLILLLAGLEMLPVVAKLMMSLGKASAYDRIREEAEDADVTVAMAEYAARGQVALADSLARVDAETKAAEDNAQKIADAQNAIFDAILQAWKDSQLAQVMADPMSYVVQGRPSTPVQQPQQAWPYQGPQAGQPVYVPQAPVPLAKAAAPPPPRSANGVSHRPPGTP
jgi:hypothetical protein